MSAAFSYLRVSGHAQKIGDGPDRQRDSIAKYAAAHDLTIAHEYPDLGVSGTTDWDDREQFVEMVKAIESDGVRIVLVERADRLARALMVNEVLLSKLRDLGVRVIEADSGNELTAGDDDPTRVLIRQVLGAVAQFNKTMTVHQLRAARNRIRKNGAHCEGNVGFGHDLRRPDEAQALTRLMQLHQSVKNPTKIANRLNQEQVPSRSGKPWSRQVVQQIIKREVPRCAP